MAYVIQVYVQFHASWNESIPFSRLLFYLWIEGWLSIEPELSTNGRVIVEDWIQSFDF